MKPKIIFFDIDGTLRDNVYHQVPDSTLKALHLLKEKGYYLCISTGRGIDSLKRTGVMDLFPFDGYVCCGGQAVLDKEGNILQHIMTDPKVVEKTLAVAKKHDIVVALKSKPRILSKEADKYTKEALAYFKSPIPEVGVYDGREVEGMIAYGPMNWDYEPFTHIKEIRVMPGESTYCDLGIAGVNKYSGISFLLERFNLSEYIAFGDSSNDLDMFEHASLSIAMGQGNETLKKQASFVTKSIDEDGIYYACKKLKLF